MNEQDNEYLEKLYAGFAMVGLLINGDYSIEEIPSRSKALAKTMMKDETDFAYFVRDVDAIIKAGKKPVVVIEASASKVPSVKYKSNDELVQLRFDSAHDLVRAALKAYGREEGKDYTFGKGAKAVQGKDYENDSKKNRLLYEQYQYVKVRVQG